MAVTPSFTKAATTHDKTFVVQWANIANGSSGDPVEMCGAADRSIQVSGTFGSGGTVVFQGSNDGSNYVTLTDPQGNPISKTAGAIEAVLEITRYVKPSVTAGDGTTSITVTMVARKP